MEKEVKNINQTERAATDAKLTYEPPKLKKHGKIHDMTLTNPAGNTPDIGGYFTS